MSTEQAIFYMLIIALCFATLFTAYRAVQGDDKSELFVEFCTSFTAVTFLMMVAYAIANTLKSVAEWVS